MKRNKKFMEYQAKLEQVHQDKLTEKNKDSPPAKMNRETKRQYIKHYSRLGVPKDEIERIIAMQQISLCNQNGGINMAEISAKVKSGELPKNTIEILSGKELK